MALSIPLSGVYANLNYVAPDYWDDEVTGGWPIDIVPNGRTASEEDVRRGRSRLGLLGTPQDVIRIVARKIFETNDPEDLLHMLRRELDARFFDWEDIYARQVIDEYNRLVDEYNAAEPDAIAAWLQRNKRAH